MNPCSIISILFFFVFGLILFQSHSENYSNYHVNYPFDSYPTKKDNQFLVKLPYRSLDTRHYKKMYYNKSTPKCVLNGTCDTTPGYYQDYHGYFDHPKKLKSFALGYSVTGYPYSTYKFNSNKYHPHYSFEYPTWYNYEQPVKNKYYGYPFYFHAKKMN